MSLLLSSVYNGGRLLKKWFPGAVPGGGFTNTFQLLPFFLPHRILIIFFFLFLFLFDRYNFFTILYFLSPFILSILSRFLASWYTSSFIHWATFLSPSLFPPSSVSSTFFFLWVHSFFTYCSLFLFYFFFPPLFLHHFQSTLSWKYKVRKNHSNIARCLKYSSLT